MFGNKREREIWNMFAIKEEWGLALLPKLLISSKLQKRRLTQLINLLNYSFDAPNLTCMHEDTSQHSKEKLVSSSIHHVKSSSGA